MKAKLIKHTDGTYILSHNPSGWCIGSTDYEYISKHKGEQIVSKLSKQNCDEIFGVVDVEKIADRHTFGQRNHEWKAYIKGFSKAMELMKDKVFTLEQMHKAIRLACSEYSGNIIDEVTQQPSEIEVEIEMEPYRMSDFVEDGNTHPSGAIERPKLDSEGCLILKKI
jgi:hypothetical protein